VEHTLRDARYCIVSTGVTTGRIAAIPRAATEPSLRDSTRGLKLNPSRTRGHSVQYRGTRCLRGPLRARWAFNFGSKSPLDPTESATKSILAIVFCCGESQCAELLYVLCLLSVSGLRASIGPMVSRTLHLSASVRAISCALQYVISGGGQLPTGGCSARHLQ
jgi:hypothetical protein